MTGTVTAWDPATRAESLARRRPALLAELPRRNADARDLSPHRQEEVLDDAIVYAAYDYDKPILDEEQLDRVLWKACGFRVMDALRGRRDTVRGGFTAVDDAALSELAADAGDPVGAAEDRYRLETLLEFARGLGPLERAVLLKRHEPPEPGKVHGYQTIARELAQPIRDVRAALRSVQRKLDAFQIVVAEREAFERKVAGLLPAPVLAEQTTRPAGWRETIIDWVTRPFGHDSATHAAALASSGGGRGIGTLAVALCLGGSVAGGTYCAVTGNIPLTGADQPTKAQRAPVRSEPREDPRQRARDRARAYEQRFLAEAAARAAARRRARARQQAAARRARTIERRRTIAQEQRRQETAQAISPAAPNAAADGSSEFDPTFQPSAPAQPAPPADSGVPEFP